MYVVPAGSLVVAVSAFGKWTYLRLNADVFGTAVEDLVLDVPVPGHARKRESRPMLKVQLKGYSGIDHVLASDWDVFEMEGDVTEDMVQASMDAAKKAKASLAAKKPHDHRGAGQPQTPTQTTSTAGAKLPSLEEALQKAGLPSDFLSPTFAGGRDCECVNCKGTGLYVFTLGDRAGDTGPCMSCGETGRMNRRRRELYCWKKLPPKVMEATGIKPPQRQTQTA